MTKDMNVNMPMKKGSHGDLPASSKPAPKPQPFKPPSFKPPPFKPPSHKQPWLPAYKPSTPQQQTATFRAPYPDTNTNPLPPTPLHPSAPKVNIRAPPRMSGRHEVHHKQPLHPGSKSILSTCTFLEKDGKKYVALSRLNDVLSQSKQKVDKGKKKDGRNAPFV
ncbi:hypothetical protein Salat_1137600 [Sesamum alatum]|uniref:Uncharacterized protein n=1 Tax=Sesamum alatum TaxID=300844 RepID=A0AAE1YDQ7_9LAMI|nr:hypothetical protein Salat_1137600 [Sesamum alatum]